MHFRPTQVIIDLNALKDNYNLVFAHLPGGVGVLGMVKADAYGHGAIPIAGTLVRCGATALGVATVEEGVELREAGIRKPILVMGGLWGQGEEAAEELICHRLTPVVHSAGVVDFLNRMAEKRKKKLNIHLKIDTGMTRLGITLQALPQVIERLKKSPFLKLGGVMTHLAFRFDPEYTRYQTRRFQEAGEKIVESLGKIPVWHIANSAAVIEGSPLYASRDTLHASRCWVRPGIMLYGIPPYPEFAKKVKLNPVMSLESQAALIKNVPKGTRVSYNGTFMTKRPSRIAVVPIGYADGFPWACSNKAHLLIEGRRCPVLGRVTMDMIMADVTNCPRARVGSRVVLLGRQGREIITADDLAGWAGTIAYEIVCRISKRMPRVYVNEK